MPLQIVRQDITKIECDAIVNAAKSTLLGGGGVDGAIHKAAGKGLLSECMGLGGCKVGQAKITGAYNLPCKYVIHTVGPIYNDGNHGEKELLESCYRESLKLAFENKCETVAFPLISSGAYGYPKAQAFQVAVDVISEFLTKHDISVFIVVFDKSSFSISERLFKDIVAYIDDNYVESHFDFSRQRSDECERRSFLPDESSVLASSAMEPFPCAQKASSPKALSLEKIVNEMDESFSQMLLRKIDEKGMTDAECYKRANVDRKLFSKIRSDVNYRPKKTTVIAFAIALELPIEETRDILMKAGYALSHSNKFDIIIEYFIHNGNFNIFAINEALFQFDQSLLGC